MENYISSRNNSLVVLASSLKLKKFRDSHELYLCEGKKLCKEALGKVTVKYVFICENKISPELKEISSASGGTEYILSENAFNKVSDDEASDGIIFVNEIPNASVSISESDKIIFLDSVRDPGNLGTIIRSAVAFGFNKILSYNCVDHYNSKVVRASMGALFNIDIMRIQNLESTIFDLKAQNRKLYAATLHETSVSINALNKEKGDVFVIGNEGHGVSEDIISMSDRCVIIPISELSESLNASIAASIVMWEYSKLSR